MRRHEGRDERRSPIRESAREKNLVDLRRLHEQHLIRGGIHPPHPGSGGDCLYPPQDGSHARHNHGRFRPSRPPHRGSPPDRPRLSQPHHRGTGKGIRPQAPRHHPSSQGQSLEAPRRQARHPPNTRYRRRRWGQRHTHALYSRPRHSLCRSAPGQGGGPSRSGGRRPEKNTPNNHLIPRPILRETPQTSASTLNRYLIKQL